MGADLYIGSTDSTDPADYFRDAYNNSSLAAHLGLDWSQLLDAYGDSEGDIPWPMAAELLQAVQDIDVARAKYRPNPFMEMINKHFLEKLGAQGMTLAPEPQPDQAYFADKKLRFEAFLRRAVEKQQPILCSI